VRAANIFRKLEEAGLTGRLGAAEIASVASLSSGSLDDGLWDVVRTCSRTLDTLEKVAESLEVSLLVRHALAVAAAFHHLYHTHPIAQEKDEATRRARRAALQVVSATLADVLGVLGVPVPARM
jgi:arginyl-tRNA synthetase